MLSFGGGLCARKLCLLDSWRFSLNSCEKKRRRRRLMKMDVYDV